MQKKEVILELEKSTKNTYRYKEEEKEDLPPILRTLYIQKWAVGSKPPQKLKITIEEAS